MKKALSESQLSDLGKTAIRNGISLLYFWFGLRGNGFIKDYVLFGLLPFY